MTRALLLVALAASASRPPERDAAADASRVFEAYRDCRVRDALAAGASAAAANRTAPPRLRADRFMVWTATGGAALGNALNLYAASFLFALYTGRTLVVGPGLVPTLLCARGAGVFECGTPSWRDALAPTPWAAPSAWSRRDASLPNATRDWRDASPDAPVLTANLRAAYAGVLRGFAVGACTVSSHTGAPVP